MLLINVHEQGCSAYSSKRHKSQEYFPVLWLYKFIIGAGIKFDNLWMILFRITNYLKLLWSNSMLPPSFSTTEDTLLRYRGTALCRWQHTQTYTQPLLTETCVIITACFSDWSTMPHGPKYIQNQQSGVLFSKRGEKTTFLTPRPSSNLIK